MQKVVGTMIKLKVLLKEDAPDNQDMIEIDPDMKESMPLSIRGFQ